MRRELFEYHLHSYGTTTDMYSLAVGTKFSVVNGLWDGEIIEIDGEKYLHIDDTGKNIKLTPEMDCGLVVEIEEESE